MVDNDNVTMEMAAKKSKEIVLNPDEFSDEMEEKSYPSKLDSVGPESPDGVDGLSPTADADEALDAELDESAAKKPEEIVVNPEEVSDEMEEKRRPSELDSGGPDSLDGIDGLSPTADDDEASNDELDESDYESKQEEEHEREVMPEVLFKEISDKLMLRLNVWPAGPTTACLSNTYLLPCLPLFFSSNLPLFPSSDLPIIPSSCPPSHLLYTLYTPSHLPHLLVHLPVCLPAELHRPSPQPATHLLRSRDEQEIYMGWLCERK